MRHGHRLHPLLAPTKPLFPRMKYVRRGRGPTASRDNSELCLSSSGNRPLFPTGNRALFLRSSPLSTFAGSFPPSSFRGSPILPAAPFTRTQKRFFDSKRWSSSRRMRLVDLRSTTSFLLFHPCPSFDLTAEIFLEIREGGVFRSRITPRRYFER